ncbi:MAG: DUF4258 domain-containing protein [Halochromatium sp.]
MSSWLSERFSKWVHMTHHAMHRMTQRGLDQEMIAALIETGGVKQKDIEHWWIFKELPGRDDNLVCAAVISRQAMIIKTIMTHWEEQDG